MLAHLCIGKGQKREKEENKESHLLLQLLDFFDCLLADALPLSFASLPASGFAALYNFRA